MPHRRQNLLLLFLRRDYQCISAAGFFVFELKIWYNANGRLEDGHESIKKCDRQVVVSCHERTRQNAFLGRQALSLAIRVKVGNGSLSRNRGAALTFRTQTDGPSRDRRTCPKGEAKRSHHPPLPMIALTPKKISISIKFLTTYSTK